MAIALPASVLWGIRVTQAIFAIIVLGTCAYGRSKLQRVFAEEPAQLTHSTPSGIMVEEQLVRQLAL